MSRKREREENSVNEPRKKAKTKNEPRKNENKVTKSQINLFDIPELVENIIKYLIKHPAMVLSIAAVSKRHHLLVYSKSFWTRLGFTNKLSRTELIEPAALKRLLIGLRTQHVENKYARECAILWTNKQRTKPIGESLRIDASFEDLILFNDDGLNWFLSQRTYTTEAVLTLQHILSTSTFNDFLQTEEFMKMIFISKEEIDLQVESTERMVNVYYRLSRYPEISHGDYRGYHVLMMGETLFSNWQYSIQKKFLSTEKSIVFMDKQLTTKATHFILINEKTKTIECCGDLIASALDPHSWETDHHFSRFDDDVMYNISYFLSKFVFGLEEVDEDLARKEFDNLNAIQTYVHADPTFGPISRLYPPYPRGYYWENIPIYLNTPQ